MPQAAQTLQHDCRVTNKVTAPVVCLTGETCNNSLRLAPCPFPLEEGLVMRPMQTTLLFAAIVGSSLPWSGTTASRRFAPHPISRHLGTIGPAPGSIAWVSCPTRADNAAPPITWYRAADTTTAGHPVATTTQAATTIATMPMRSLANFAAVAGVGVVAASKDQSTIRQ